MATAAYQGSVSVQGGGGGGYTAMAGVNNVSVSLSRTLVDVSAMNGSDDFVKRLAALKDFPMSISGFFAAADTAYGHMKANFASGTQLEVRIYFDPTAGAGNTGFYTDCMVESIEVSASVDGAQEVSISLQSNSDVTFLS